MNVNEKELIVNKPGVVRYSGKKDSSQIQPSLDSMDNANFTSTITRAIKALDARGEKLTPRNISRESRYNMKEIELNLFEIGQIIDSVIQ